MNVQDPKGRTLVMYAARDNQNPEVVRGLLKAGGDVKAQDNEGETVWDYIQSNEKLKRTEVYWKIHEALFSN